MTDAQVRDLQRDLNYFTKWGRLGVPPLIVDGNKGPATDRRIARVKFWLGFGKRRRGPAVSREFRRQLAHPKRPLGRDELHHKRVARGKRRRKRTRRENRRNQVKAVRTSGVTQFDGRPVAKWMVPYLQWARNNGWHGTLVSGWRDPVYSERLCYQICGAPFCSGRCAGRSSNHSGSTPPHGAVDVSDWATFGSLMKRCPLSPKLWNALGARDPVHFSASGR